jgi:putative endonuclease
MLRVRKAMRPAVYMLCKHRHCTLQTGITSDLARRVWEHRTGAVEGFSRRYGLKALVWYEPHGTMEEAIFHEKHIKAWKRGWKSKLIERMNPTWRDLYEDLNR